MFRRETIIALRARHQAYRIASEILHPHLDAPAPPQPVIPLDLPGYSSYGRRLNVQGLIPAAVIWGMVALYWLLTWLSGGN